MTQLSAFMKASELGSRSNAVPRRILHSAWMAQAPPTVSTFFLRFNLLNTELDELHKAPHASEECARLSSERLRDLGWWHGERQGAFLFEVWRGEATSQAHIFPAPFAGCHGGLL